MLLIRELACIFADIPITVFYVEFSLDAPFAPCYFHGDKVYS